MPLTDAQIRSLKPHSSRYKRSDAAGLYLDVMPSGKKTFRLAYRFAGKQSTIWIGEYPSTRLIDARLKSSEIKTHLRNGVDPKASTSDKSDMNVKSDPHSTWQKIAEGYLMLRQRDGAAARTMKKLDRQIRVTIAALGERDIKNISPEDVLSVVNPIAERGHVENAHEIRSRFSQVFRYAIARGLAKVDPAAVTIDAMVKRKRGEFAGLTEPKDVRHLLEKINEYREQHFWVGSALLLSAHTFPRNSELRGMEWTEIDWENANWEIPAERMKMRREHVVPLSIQSLEILSELKEFDVGSTLVFPAPRDPNRWMSENTFNSALRRMGYQKEQHVHHGFRTTASTTLNEQGWNSDWIERQLAHVSINKVRSSYNKAEYLSGRAKMMQKYSDWLSKPSLELPSLIAKSNF